MFPPHLSGRRFTLTHKPLLPRFDPNKAMELPWPSSAPRTPHPPTSALDPGAGSAVRLDLKEPSVCSQLNSLAFRQAPASVTGALTQCLPALRLPCLRFSCKFAKNLVVNHFKAQLNETVVRNDISNAAHRVFVCLRTHR